MLPCLTNLFYFPVNDILTIAKAISVYFSNLFNCIMPTCGESTSKAWKLRAIVAVVLSGDLPCWVLEIAQLLCCDLCSAPLLAVDKMLAAADELQAYFRGYFVFACRITKRQQLGNLKWKPPVPGLENESYAEAKQMVMRRWSFLARRFATSDALFCCSWTPTSTVFLALLRMVAAAVIILHWQKYEGFMT